MAAHNNRGKLNPAFRRTMEQDLAILMSGYLRTGSKANHQRQHKRMKEFVDYCETVGVRSLGQIGRSHVIKFWKSHRQLEDKTLQDYWYAFRILWKAIGQPGEPPRAWTTAMRQAVEAARPEKDSACFFESPRCRIADPATDGGHSV